MAKKDTTLNEATRRRTITEREIFDLIGGRIDDAKFLKINSYPRDSTRRLELTGAIREMIELKKDIRAAISRGRKGGEK